jgi:site-specific DNA-methyltransferase (adenine-specific)
MPDMVSIGPHRLYLGDAYIIRPTLGWMDADVMDPPYQFRAQGGGAYRNARSGGMDQIVSEELHKGFEFSIINPLLCGSAVVFCHNDQLAKLLPFVDGNFERYALCVWQKKNPQPFANKHYRPDVEFYVHCWSRGYHPQGGLSEKARTVDAYSVRGKAKRGHPTVKPDAVMDKIVRNVAGSTVCDPFMGTGSTGVAAIKAGLIFTGIEHNPAHFETAVARLHEAHEAAR